MQVETFIKIMGSDFYTGVPDSLLKPLCSYLTLSFGDDTRRHIIAANEGNCAAIAAGYHLATGKFPVVYMQNSGEGNIINPVLSLLRVYEIPVIFVIGWRGEPGAADEPQHLYQGDATLALLDDIGVPYFIMTPETSAKQMQDAMALFRLRLANGGGVAFVVRKGALVFDGKVNYKNDFAMTREAALRRIILAATDDVIVSTTGKTSRELFELRESLGMGHQRDFLTVGSMGHASSIALGIAIHCPVKRVWCVDGDGAALMHMGALGVIGAASPMNFIHVVINNGAHESVGGMPTAMRQMRLLQIAEGCGYKYTALVENESGLESELSNIKNHPGPALLETRCAIGSRADLGRPTISAVANKEQFVKYLKA